MNKKHDKEFMEEIYSILCSAQGNPYLGKYKNRALLDEKVKTMNCKNHYHFMYLDIEGRCPYCKETKDKKEIIGRY